MKQKNKKVEEDIRLGKEGMDTEGPSPRKNIEDWHQIEYDWEKFKDEAKEKWVRLSGRGIP